jgi:carbon monoxide dehydrogenase subunit G
VRLEETFVVARPPEVVFDYLTDPAKVAEWQTSKSSVEQLTSGPPGLGTRVRERTKPPRGREFEQVVEFTEFDRPRRVHVHVVEGPYPIDGSWTFEPDGAGTRVHFVAEGDLPGAMRLFGPVLKRLMGRQFADYHRRLVDNLTLAR